MVGDSKSSPIDHFGDIWLKDLPPIIKRYQYKGERQFQEGLDVEYDRLQHYGDASELLLFEIDQEKFSCDFLNAKDTQSKSWSSFSAIEWLLLLEMMSYEHAVAQNAFDNALIQALTPMGLGQALRPYAGVIIEGGKDDRKKGDNAWGSSRWPRGRDQNWPTVVLEVAVSEPQSKLQSDVRFWLGQGQGNVNIVFTLTVDCQKPRIWIEKWESMGDREHRTQQVTVYRGANNRVYITGYPLTIEFLRLSLRDTSSPKEADINSTRVFSKRCLFGMLKILKFETLASFVFSKPMTLLSSFSFSFSFVFYYLRLVLFSFLFFFIRSWLPWGDLLSLLK